MSTDLYFNRVDALKAGFTLERSWDDLIPGHEQEQEIFIWQMGSRTIRQQNYSMGEVEMCVQYLRNDGKGAYLKSMLESMGIEVEHV